MNYKKKKLFSNFKFENWKNLTLFAIFTFYLILFIAMVWKGSFLSDYGGDYLAFWSIGKIAGEEGYSEIYDLDNLIQAQSQVLSERGLLNETGDTSYAPIPAPIFSFFVPPFQLLSLIDIQLGYWVWTLSNLALVFAYLVFFQKKVFPVGREGGSDLKIIILLLAAFPLFNNIFGGQIQYFLLICIGEFIRNAVNKKPILSGIWLGGLLLKPQLLILIVPILLILRYWKTLSGFIISSGVVFFSSLFLSGYSGTKALVNLWTKYAVGMSSNAPEFMINWRMIGVNLFTHLNISIGWGIAGVGIILTVFAVYLLLKRIPPFGSPPWVRTMLGVFIATLLLTWHSHFHLALVLLPFFAYILKYQLIPEKLVFFWVVFTPAVLFALKIFGLIFYLSTGKIFIHEWEMIGLSGLIVNLVILFSITKPSNDLALNQA